MNNNRGPQRFEEQYHCYSMACADKGHLEGGDKILLPPSAFDTLARLNIEYPMLFRLVHSSSTGNTADTDLERVTHSGVLEFTAEEGSCYVPFWMMQNLLVGEGGLLTISNISLPKATFVKLQPQHKDFLEAISNPRAVLEHALRNFSCVTKGDVICVPYNNRNYHFLLKEVQPQDAACIIETDCNVDFDAPPGYVDPYEKKGNGASSDQQSQTNSKYASMPKQSANGGISPAQSSLGISGSSIASVSGNGEEQRGTGSTKIVNGVVVRSDENVEEKIDASMLAEKTGATGVQSNSAVPIKVAGVDYWAVDAGGGARLDGKTATPLKDKFGNEVNVRELRAAAAAARAKEYKSEIMNSTSQSNETVSRARKSRIGGKYSKRKNGVASFHGSGKSM